MDSSDTEDYDNKLQHIVKSWRNSEMPSTSESEPVNARTNVKVKCAFILYSKNSGIG